MDTKKTLLGLFAALAIGVLTVSHAKDISVEYGVEADTSSVLLPASALGSVVLTCENCKERSYPLTSATVYQLGQAAVSYAQFAAYVHTATGPLTIFIKPDSSAVTRIVMSGRLNTQTNTPQAPATTSVHPRH